jgi:sugar fermentation stimulation protein A
VRIDKPLIEGRLLRRYKRFLADVELADGALVTAHCPNPGRLIGCLPDAARVVLRDSRAISSALQFPIPTISAGCCSAS